MTAGWAALEAASPGPHTERCSWISRKAEKRWSRALSRLPFTSGSFANHHPSHARIFSCREVFAPLQDAAQPRKHLQMCQCPECCLRNRPEATKRADALLHLPFLNNSEHQTFAAH